MVESYYNSELSDVIFDIDAKEEWASISKELGLESQLKFVEKAKSPMPYPFLNTSMTNVFNTLCPRHVELASYKTTPIPLDVLKEIKFCINEGFFDIIEIWYDDKTPDPFAVGVINEYSVYYYETPDKKDGSKKADMVFKNPEDAKKWVEENGYTFYFVTSPQQNRYLISRWGDELKPYAKLKELAKERLIEKYSNDYNKTIKDLQNRLQQVKENVLLFLNANITEYDLSKNCN